MSSQLILLVLLQILIAGSIGQSGASESSNLDCSGVEQVPIKSILQDKKSACKQVIDLAPLLKDDQKPRKFEVASNLDRFDLIHSCTCNIISKSTIWTSLLNNELFDFYEVVRDYMSDKVEKPVARHIMMSKPMARKWNEINILDAMNGLYQVESSFYMWNDWYAIYKKKGITRELDSLVKIHCVNLKKSIPELKLILENLTIVSKNQQFMSRIAAFDMNMLKVMTLDKACEIITEQTK